MKATELIAALKRKLGRTTQGEVAEALGLSMNTLSLWNKRDKDLTPDQVASALVKARSAAVAESQFHTIKPIVEHFPILKTESRQKAKFELFEKASDSRNKGLYKALKATAGIYIFYDSRGQALYVGKAGKSLWDEMHDAYNRNREVQQLKLVEHQNEDEEFIPAYEQGRQHKPTQLKLCDLSFYFSAYFVDDGMISDLEALLVRGFANDLLNVKMERFAHARYQK